jgi:tetratricopeptide (TPR) repeat protein
MAGTTHFTLAYCSANQSQAQELDQILSKAGISFQHLSCSKEKDSLAAKLNGAQTPILLLISDNFLKSAPCIHETHGIIQKLIRSEQLLPIIIDGVHTKEDGSPEYVHTHFDRVSHVIQYMNYWQDQYLEVRKEKRNAEPNEEPEIDEQLRVIRSISSDIGEFLRFVRNSEHYSFEAFSAGYFELFFRKYDLLSRHPAFKEQLIRENISVSALSTIETPATTSQSEEKVNQEEEPDNLQDIPGINLLQEKEDEDDPNLIEQIYSEEEEEEGEMDDEAEEAGLPSDNGVEQPGEPVEEEEEETADETPTPASDQDDSFLEEDGGNYGLNQEENKEEEGVPQADQELHELQSLYKEDLDEDFMEGSLLDFDEDEDEDEEDEDEDEDDSVLEDLFEEEEPQEETEGELSQVAKTANYLIHTGEVDQGLSLFRTILKNQPENHAARFQYASALMDYQDNKDEGKKQLELILEENNTYYPVYIRLAELAERNEDFQKARDHYQKAAELKPSLPEIDYKLGLLLQSHFPEEKEEAARYFYQALKKNPKNVDATYRYALLLAETAPEKDKKAAKYFKRTLKVNRDHPFANYDLALIYHRSEKWEKAAKYYMKACRINPELRTSQNDQAFGIGPDGEMLFQSREKAKKKGSVGPKAIRSYVSPELLPESAGLPPNCSLSKDSGLSLQVEEKIV